MSRNFLKNLQPFRLVTFDITETLLRFRYPPAIQYAKTASILGITGIDQECLQKCFIREFKAMSKLHPNFGRNSTNLSWHDWWKQLVKNIFYCVKPDIESEIIDKLANTLIRIYRTKECWCHIPGNVELLSRVRNANKIMGVISNSEPSLLEVLQEMNLLNYFDFVLTSYEAGCVKPHRDIYEIPLKKCGIKSAEAVHIGNIYEVDYMGAKNAGWSSLLITKDEKILNKAMQTQAYRTIRDLLKALDTKIINW